ncbi:MAG: sugar transporter [Bacteroidetes bacterium]|nr:MAG: sugar transporter [Bacteroidota bacterium]
MIRQYPFLLLACTCLLFTGCVSHSELLNFNEGEFVTTPIPPAPAMIIQVDDLLSISVRTLDEQASAPFNLESGNLNMAEMGAGRPIIGYLVDNEGYLDFPVIGRIPVAGLTVNQLKAQLNEALKTYLIDPVINIRFINFRITLVGEVRSPGSYVMPNERVTILDAIGLAGDLTSYANRANILIVREQNGQREYGYVNIHDKAIFQSPYFYLRQNDYIYVEPLPEVTASVRDQSQRILPWVGLATTLVTLTLTLMR